MKIAGTSFKIDYDVSQRASQGMKLEKTLFLKIICTYNKSKRANQYSLWKKASSMLWPYWNQFTYEIP